MHRAIDKAYAEKCRSFIQESNVYIITNIRVMPVGAIFSPVKNGIVINFFP
jgi:hypothetical protein